VALSEPSPDRTATTIAVTGPVTRAEVARWRGAFADALSQRQCLRLDLSASGPWDVAGVQLLLAAIASGQAAGGPISLARVPKVLTAVAERAGLLDPLAAITEQ
jgi:ABC-type transporter Mla MlaB component